MKKQVYRHYGSSEFNFELLYTSFNECDSTFKNINFKPVNCLWSSPFDSKLNWKDWCIQEEFRLDSLEEYFDFTLKDSANIYKINSIEDLRNLLVRFPGEKIDCSFAFIYKPFDSTEAELKHYPDFRLISYQYDGIEVNISSDPSLYYWMYGYDVDSLVIWNPDVIEPL